MCTVPAIVPSTAAVTVPTFQASERCPTTDNLTGYEPGVQWIPEPPATTIDWPARADAGTTKSDPDVHDPTESAVTTRGAEAPAQAVTEAGTLASAATTASSLSLTRPDPHFERANPLIGLDRAGRITRPAEGRMPVRLLGWSRGRSTRCHPSTGAGTFPMDRRTTRRASPGAEGVQRGGAEGVQEKKRAVRPVAMLGSQEEGRPAQEVLLEAGRPRNHRQQEVLLAAGRQTRPPRVPGPAAGTKSRRVPAPPRPSPRMGHPLWPSSVTPNAPHGAGRWRLQRVPVRRWRAPPPHRSGSRKWRTACLELYCWYRPPARDRSASSRRHRDRQRIARASRIGHEGGPHLQDP